MRTYEKRNFMQTNFTKEFGEVFTALEADEYRAIDVICQDLYNPTALQYVITLLCDELMRTSKNEGMEL